MILDTVFCVGKIKDREDQTKIRQKSNLHNKITSFLIQNLKTLSLWIFFLVYSLTFLFPLNVELKLILGYLIFWKLVEWSIEEKGRGLRTSYTWDMCSLKAKWAKNVPMFCYSLGHWWGSKRDKEA